MAEYVLLTLWDYMSLLFSSLWVSCCSIFIFLCSVLQVMICPFSFEGAGGSMSQVVGLPNNSYKPIPNTVWVRARLCKSQKGCTRLAVASDKAYQLLAHGWWFSPGTTVSSTTKTGRHDIVEILLKVALKHQKSKSKSFFLWPLYCLSFFYLRF